MPALRWRLLFLLSPPDLRHLHACLGPAAAARAWAIVRSRAFRVPAAPGGGDGPAAPRSEAGTA